jgi:hypothetical protein
MIVGHDGSEEGERGKRSDKVFKSGVTVDWGIITTWL